MPDRDGRQRHCLDTPLRQSRAVLNIVAADEDRQWKPVPQECLCRDGAVPPTIELGRHFFCECVEAWSAGQGQTSVMRAQDIFLADGCSCLAHSCWLQ